MVLLLPSSALATSHNLNDGLTAKYEANDLNDSIGSNNLNLTGASLATVDGRTVFDFGCLILS